MSERQLEINKPVPVYSREYGIYACAHAYKHNIYAVRTHRSLVTGRVRLSEAQKKTVLGLYNEKRQSLGIKNMVGLHFLH